ncbi:pentapeptide repeat-containing protein [Streptomyces sp. NPDC048637]|uniref:pentapeptide repeat-containing protein n=1 Tax=Streptomyces sp. NPDC048637 TaxID=3155636 RepID=UPI0034323295
MNAEDWRHAHWLDTDWRPWDPDHLARIEEGDAGSWNRWRDANPQVKPRLWTTNLSRKNLAGCNLSNADLRSVSLVEADLRGTNFQNARLRGASMRDADLREADLRGADLSPAQLEEGDGGVYYSSTILTGAKLSDCNLAGADLSNSNLSYCQFIGTDLSNASLDGATVFGTSAWDVKLNNTSQRNLRITRENQPYLAIDRLELAQFIYMLIENAKLRDVLDTVTVKTVLILGRFSEERMTFLNLTREAVRSAGKIPILFDFAVPANKDLTGTVEVLARLAHCVVVDLSDPRSVPHELATVVPFLRTTPVVPLLDSRSSTYGMFPDIASYPWVLDVHEYRSERDLNTILPSALKSAEKKFIELRNER